MSKGDFIKKIVEDWPKAEPIYQELGQLIKKRLKQEIFEVEIYPNVSFRIKDTISLIKKAVRLGGDNPYEKIKDKLGVRIVCQFKSDLRKIEPIIDSLFDVKKKEQKDEELKFNELGYTSDHYDVKVKKGVFEKIDKYDEIVFEIQVRTLCQNTWADIAHGLTYKQEDQDELTKRKVFRLTSLFEISDDEFDSINEHLIKDPKSFIYSVLRSVEGKFYKIAKRKFDWELSIQQLTNVINIDVNNKIEVNTLLAFIGDNEDKISKILEERKSEYYSNLFISQPEVLVIWFLIENDKYTLEEEWPKYYDINDLNDLAIYWGQPLD